MPRYNSVLGQPMSVVDADVPPGLLVVVIADIDDYEVARIARGNEWADEQVARTGKLVEALLPPGARSALVPPDSWVVTVPGELPGATTAQALAYAEQLLRHVGDETDVVLTLSVSNPHAGPARLEVATGEAVQAVERKLIGGGGRIYQYLDESDATVTPPERVEGDLARCIRDSDADGAIQALRQWIERIAQTDGVTPDMLRRWLGAELMHALDVAGTRRLADGSTDWIMAFDRLSLDELFEMFHIHERSYLMLWLEQLLPRIVDTEAPQSPGRHVLALVEKFIADHYAEDLKLGTVANAVYVSPFYISHLFQRELGTTFLRYLTGVRMRHAAHMLGATDRPVEVIAAQVGYASTKRFRLLFKRTFGVTPTEFRRRPSH